MDITVLSSKVDVTTFQGRVLIAAAVASVYLLIDLSIRVGPFRRKVVRHFKTRNPKLDNAELSAISRGTAPRVAVFIHNLIGCSIAFAVLSDPAHKADPFHHTSSLSLILMANSAGYFLYDAFASIYDVRHEGMEFVVHGVGCFTVYMYGWLLNKVHYFGAGFILWELSTFNVQLRWYLWNLGHGSTQAYLVNGLAMALVFFLVRIAWGYSLTWTYWAHSYRLMETDLTAAEVSALQFFRGLSLVLNGLNTYWFYLMMNKIISYAFRLGGKKAKAN